MSVIYRWKVQNGPHRRCEGARAKSGDLFPFPFPSPQNKKFPRPTSHPWKEAEKGEVRELPSGGQTALYQRPCQVLFCAQGPRPLSHVLEAELGRLGTLLMAALGAGLWVSRLGGWCPKHPEAWHNPQQAPALRWLQSLSLACPSPGHGHCPHPAVSGQTPRAQCSRRLWVWLHSACPEAQAHCLSQFCGQRGPGGASFVPVMLVGCSPGLGQVAQRSGISRGQGSAWPLEWLYFSVHTVSGLCSYSE